VPTDLVAQSGNGMERVLALASTDQVDAAWQALGDMISRKELQDREALAFYLRLTGEVARASKAESGSAAASAVVERAEQTLAGVSATVDPRIILFRIESLDAQKDAKAIRALRETLADLRLDPGLGRSQEEK
jgi:hypothetical protein